MHQLAFEFRAVDQRDVKEANEKASLDTPLWDPHGDPEDHSGDRLLTRGNDSHVKIWRIGDAGLIGSPTVFDSDGDVLSASWSADGKRVLVTSSAEPYATLWDPERGIHRPLSGLTNPVLNPVWSPDGRWLAVSGDHGKVTIYPSTGGDPRSVLPALPDQGSVEGIAWNHRSTQLATGGGDKMLRIWNIDGGKPREYPGYGGNISEVAWSPNDALILGTGGDKTAMVWDVTSADKLTVLTGHTRDVNFAIWDRTGKRVLTSGWDGVARVHLIGWEAYHEAACERIVRNLSKVEWRTYLGDDEWHETCPGKSNP
jgi:WD40 repeat protein